MPTDLAPRSETDTTPEWHGPARARRARAARRVLLALFGTVLLLGAAGLLGVRAATVEATGGGYELRVRYPRVTRPGHAVPLAVEVRRVGGFGDGTVAVSMTSDYFTLFDENGMQPAPSTETATRENLLWEFDPPPGDTLRIYFDTRTGPNKQRGERGEVSVLVAGEPVVTAELRTWVLP